MAEVFVVAWRRFGELPEEPLPWLLGVSRKVVSEHWRAATRRRPTVVARPSFELEGH